MKTIHAPLLIIDGHCILCNRWAVRIFKNDISKKFYFTTNQSEAAKELFSRFNIEFLNDDTLYFYDGEKMHAHADAVFMISEKLGGKFKLISFFRFLPKAIHRFAYNMIAKNRYRIFGRKNFCSVDEKIPAERILG